MMRMNKKFGLYIRGELVNTYDDAIEAHKDAIFAQEESQVPYEVKEVKKQTKIDEFTFKLSENLIPSENNVLTNMIFKAKRRGATDLFDVTNDRTAEAYIYTNADVVRYINNNDWILTR